MIERGENSEQRITGPSLAKSQVNSCSPVSTDTMSIFPFDVPIVTILNRSIYVR